MSNEEPIHDTRRSGCQARPVRAHFVLPGETTAISVLEQLDPDRDWQEFVTTTRAWVLQTFLRLRAAGSPVHLGDRLPGDGIAVVSPGDYRTFLRTRWARSGAYIVATRGSFRRTPPFADAEIVQNMAQADGRNRFFMTHWPQPGLVPRDATRGTQIKRIAYKGFPANLRQEFREPRWREFLAAHDIEWVEDATTYATLQTDTRKLQWPDYRDVDLVLAVRDHDPAMYPGRPATKLFNAWLAGVPALLGPELAYRAEREHPDDYIEVDGVAGAQHAVLQLLEQPHRYRALLERAEVRARQVDIAATTRRWQSLLFEQLQPRAAQPTRQRTMLARQLAGRVRWALARCP